MRRGLAAIGLVGALALVGCEQTTTVPSGAQVVHVVVRPASVTLDPPTAHAGDLYLVLDDPPDGPLTFVATADTATVTPGPLTDDDVRQILAGNAFHTAVVAFGAGGCSPDQDAAARGKAGPCGNAFKVTVAPGAYLIAGGSPERDPTTGRVPPMAELRVTP
jgi:hypothetical protein